MDGAGAEEYLLPHGEAAGLPFLDGEVPLLHATTGGSRYERSEIERVQGPLWPGGWIESKVRLFAEDRTVVEQHFLVVRQENGRLGLATLETFKPDLVLLDMHMPELDGAGTLREVARRWPTLPVIMVTVNEDVETTSRLLQLGAADYVPKPFDLDYLDQAVSTQVTAAQDR